MSSDPLRLGRGVRAWYAPILDLAAAEMTHARLPWLSTDERARYDRFRADADRQMFLLGRIMARALVGAALGIAPGAWRWGEGPRGRPEIASPSTALRFNLAHSSGLVACALGFDREVGIDVEDLQRRPVDVDVVRRYCSAGEVADIERHGDRWHDRFLHYWTLKESYLKARGLGIALPLEQVAFRLEAGRAPRLCLEGALAAGDQARWTFAFARPTDRHLLAVAASTGDEEPPSITVERLTGYLPPTRQTWAAGFSPPHSPPA
jgi:4'-phosphopantetheinyl transferase